METKPVEDLVEDAIRLLFEFIPQKTYLYFPLLSACVSWAIRRKKQWKKRIFSWEVWPDPGIVEVKPDTYILRFFSRDISLRKAYKDQIESRDFESLRKAFSVLYPILGLEDPFLTALFQKELERHEYRKVVAEFEPIVNRAKKDIKPLKGEPRLLKSLKAFADEMASLKADLLSQDKVRQVFAELLKKQIEEIDD